MEMIVKKMSAEEVVKGRMNKEMKGEKSEKGKEEKMEAKKRRYRNIPRTR